jgi:hypothetical protein
VQEAATGFSRENHFLNRTSKGEINTGTRGKFNETQTEERIKLHAKSVATKFPSMPQMLQIYKEQFNIDITLESEKQWRKTNWDLIQKKKLEMIDTGEIVITTIGVKALADSMQTLVIDTSKTLVKMRLKLHSCLEKIEEGSKVIGERKPMLVNDNLETFKALSDAMAKLSSSLTKQMGTLADLSGHARAYDKEQDEEDFEKEASKTNENFDPSAVEISEEDRKLLE